MADGDRNTSVVPYQPQYIVIQPGQSSGSSHTGAIVGVVAVVAVVGVAGYLIWYEFIRKKPDISKDFDPPVVTILTPTVPIGGTAKISVTMTNISTKIQNPVLRFDLWQALAGKSPKEGTETTVGDIAVGASKTIELDFVLPSDWTGGSTLNAQLVLIGNKGTIWAETGCIAVLEETQTFTIDSVTAINPVLLQGDVQTAKVTVAVTNNTSVPIVNRRFRLDLKRGPESEQLTISWNEGPITTVPSIPTGQSSFELDSCAVPTGWSLANNNSPIAIKIQDMVKGGAIYGDLNGSDAYRIFTLVTTAAQAYLEIISSGLAGLESTWVPVGTPFRYDIDYNNTDTVPIQATFIFGIRTQNWGETYSETSQTFTLKPGSGTVTIKSYIPNSHWDGDILDVRILVSKGATIFVTNGQGEDTDTTGVQRDIIYEGDKVAGVGAVVTSGPKAEITNEYVNLHGKTYADVIVTVKNTGTVSGQIGIGPDINNILATAFLDAGESYDLTYIISLPGTNGTFDETVLGFHQTTVGNWVVDDTLNFRVIVV
jgi:hypothetical protein